MDVALHGIGSCQTCRKARAWLDAQRHSYTWVDLREAPPARGRIAAWVNALGPKALRNSSGASYRALPTEKERWSEERWIDAYHADPMLIRRPVLEIGGRARAAGFRSADWEQLLGASCSTGS